MEVYLVAGLQGVVSNYVEEVLELKKQTAALILCKLNETAKTKVARMIYTNFDSTITAKYGIIVEGWPLTDFCCPSDVGSHNELLILSRVFETGTTRFHLLSSEEFKRWKEERLPVATPVRPSTDPAQSQSDNPTPSTVPVHVDTPPPTSTVIFSLPQPPTPALSVPSTTQCPSLPEPPEPASSPPLSMPFAPPPLPPPTLLPAHYATQHSLLVLSLGGEDHAGNKQKHATPISAMFINTVTMENGLGITIPMKTCKVRSDKGIKHGPRRPQSGGRENVPIEAANSLQT
ncbi:hypothetical protein WOLCODRAFT_153320 [Wolfiporia cocos MD-104 SS10]|uniref:Uncharacterized protein n=1 Tax=Wolfiporia cocos (strain MD-104) TaxID=742152 RepID=A0A2H3JZF4_WOLCO|nr:hypothetical protein WOLCODRAFT_153320 [Wolfiporia cocos MD-104 SS10]